MLKRMIGKLLETKLQRVGHRVSVALLGFVAVPVFCAGLNDTGITYCSNENANGVVCSSVASDSGAYPRQDARYGRDAQNSAGKLAKIGADSVGFDYTKIGNNGTVLAASALQGGNPGDWACTRDNVTGLIWEVKTNSGLHYQSYTYSWYSPSSTSNGGAPGNLNKGTCSIGSCDTKNFIDTVNFGGLCGATDWRLPTVKELQGLSNYGAAGPAIDFSYFPNTPALPFWSGTASAVNGSTTAKYYAWDVDTQDGNAKVALKSSPLLVRLVRGGL